MSASDSRDAFPGVMVQFVDRWSPRAFAEGEVSDEALSRIIEAARWAPSCFNEQPWRFYTSHGGNFDDYLKLLVEPNQVWARNASVIGFLVGKKNFARNGKPNPVFALDCGAAWMSLALQTSAEGLYSHGMMGIEHDAVAEYLSLDADEDAVLMGFAIGHIGDAADLPESLREREAPSGRHALADIWLSSGS
ncbi:MAG: nitroreductase family protein [Pseudomonadota bacterium]